MSTLRPPLSLKIGKALPAPWRSAPTPHPNRKGILPKETGARCNTLETLALRLDASLAPAHEEAAFSDTIQCACYYFFALKPPAGLFFVQPLSLSFYFTMQCTYTSGRDESLPSTFFDETLFPPHSDFAAQGPENNDNTLKNGRKAIQFSHFILHSTPSDNRHGCRLLAHHFPYHVMF